MRPWACCLALLCLGLVAAPLRAEAKSNMNVVYCKVGDQELQMDIFQPDGDGPFPAIVCIHGGGWSGGNRQSQLGLCALALKNNYVAATVTYRLVKKGAEVKIENAYPCAIEDVKCAVRFLRANAEKYHIDPKRIGATGQSAGGHLSLMLGLSDAKAGLEGAGGYADQSSQVQAVVNTFGPTDMVELAKTSQGAAPIVATFLGGAPEAATENYAKSSPVTYISAGDAPVLTIHGTADTLVPPGQAKELDEKMKAAGLEHELLLLEGEGHGFKPQANIKAAEATFAFFKKHLKP